MKRYSAFAVAREALRNHTGWNRAWAKPTQPKKKYDAIIVGAGGHGLATAYYLGKNFGITNVAILEKGWLGGGNTGRNTGAAWGHGGRVAGSMPCDPRPV